MKHDFHNPNNLTAKQVGEGYRLLLKSEIKKRIKPHKEIEGYLSSAKEWHKSRCGYYGDNKHVTYRVPLATWPLPSEDKQDALITSNQVLMDKVAELESKLQKAEARLAQLEWVPFSERKPKESDANVHGYVEMTDGIHTGHYNFSNGEPHASWTHWRPFAPPITVDKDRAEFEKWWEANKENIASFESEALQIWKAARENF